MILLQNVVIYCATLGSQENRFSRSYEELKWPGVVYLYASRNTVQSVNKLCASMYNSYENEIR